MKGETIETSHSLFPRISLVQHSPLFVKHNILLLCVTITSAIPLSYKYSVIIVCSKFTGSSHLGPFQQQTRYQRKVIKLSDHDLPSIDIIHTSELAYAKHIVIKVVNNIEGRDCGD
jgi:hypothetical protein